MNRRGLTLLELMVALTITGAALAAGYGAFAAAVDHRGRALEATDGVTRATGGRRVLRDWIAGARLYPDARGPEFRGLDGVASGAPDDELTFLTDARTPLGDAPAVVRLFIERSDTTRASGLVAEFVEWRGTTSRTLVLEPKATGLDVRYLSGVLGSSRWLPSWISRTVLPRGVELLVSAAPGDTLPALLTLPVTVPIGVGR